MSPVELYSTWSKGTTAKLVEDWDHIFKWSSAIVLVESQDEYDYVWAMQLICGGSVTIHIVQSGEDWRELSKKKSFVFLSWDPSDPNRI